MTWDSKYANHMAATVNSIFFSASLAAAATFVEVFAFAGVAVGATGGVGSGKSGGGGSGLRRGGGASGCGGSGRGGSSAAMLLVVGLAITLIEAQCCCWCQLGLVEGALQHAV